MNDKTLYAVSAVLFAAIFLVAIIVYSDGVARQIALGATLSASMSQFVAQDHRAHQWSIGFAYGAFLLAVVSLIAFCLGT